MKHNSTLQILTLLFLCSMNVNLFAKSYVKSKMEVANTKLVLNSVSQVESNPCGIPHQAFQGNVITLPGVIEAENYNEGCNGEAFNDTNVQNEGGVYRTESVDLEACTEGGFNLGWTESGEWLNYRVEVENTGVHNFVFRVASLEGGGQFHLEINNQDITGSIDVPSTGGWQNWENISIDGVTLNSGIQDIRLVITQNGFNLNNFSAAHIIITQAPEITSINHSPVSPTSSENIVVSAEITDDGVIASAQLQWGLAIDQLTNSLDLTMVGNSYTATLPTQSEGSTVFYQITAEDNEALKTTSEVNSVTVRSVDINEPKLVWSDEFNYTGLPDPSKWGYDTGNGGFGNNELQNYTVSRLENARVENGNLIIEARRDWHDGIEYSSARMVTRNKGDWLYGRVEVRAKLPTAGRGTWPAIWMLPTDWEYGGWPKSGEIDIMENVGYDPNIVHGTVHTEAYNHTKNTQLAGKVEKFNYASEFHIYAINWTEDKIDFFIDDELYFTHVNHGGFEEWPFDKRFHLILNMAVGGDWGGAQGVDSSIWPKQMQVDYVRVYDKPVAEIHDTVNLPGTVEAENYNGNSGVQKEVCEEGGQNVGFIDSGDWMKYDVNVTESGTYKVEYRVASNESGGVISLEQNSGNTILGTLEVPFTGGWQNWQTISHSVQLGAGKQEIAIGVPSGGYNLNWIKFTKEGGGEEIDPIHIEAEEFTRMEGIQTESCNEGGENIGWTDRDDWLSYTVNIPAGNYIVRYRVASQIGGGELQLEKAGGGVIYGNTTFPATGGWQNWQTFTDEVIISENLEEIAINIRNGGFNLNWISLTPVSSNGREISLQSELTLYPNPVMNYLQIKGVSTISSVKLYTIDGTSIKPNLLGNKLNVQELQKGVYILHLVDDHSQIFVGKFLKQ